MSKYRLLLLLVTLSALFTFSGCSSKDDDPEDDTEEVVTDPPSVEEPVAEKKYLNGIAVDGYLDESVVKYCSQSGASIRGKFSFEYKATCKESIKISGGTDMATGEAFEGFVKAPAPTDVDNLDVIATPLTTLVASLVEGGQSKSEAEGSISTSLGIDVEALNVDPIAELKSDDPEKRERAAATIKKALVVQKLTETASKSVDQANREVAFGSIMGAIASNLNSGKKFDEVISDTDSIMEEASKSIDDPDQIKRLKSSASAAGSVAKIVNDIDESELAKSSDAEKALQLTSKSVEVVTSKIEELVAEKIGEAELNDNNELELDLSEITAVEKAVTMFGGIEGIQSSIEKTGDVAGVDATDFAEKFLSDENIEAQANTYDIFIENNISIEDIKKIGVALSESTEDLNDTDLISNIVITVVGEDTAVDLDSISDAIKDGEELKTRAIEDAQNSAPIFKGEIGDINGKVGEAIETRYLNNFFSDEDGEKLTITLTCELPEGLQFNNGVISGVPTEATKANSVVPCKAEATDGKKTAKSNPFNIQIVDDSVTVPADENTTVPADENTTVPADENTTVPADENTTVPTVENPAPTVATQIGDISGTVNVAISPVDVSSNFSDTDDNLTFTLSTCNGLAITGSTISGTPSMIGTTECTVTATDTADQSVSDKFNLVATAPISAPAKISDVSDIVLSEGLSYSKNFSSNFSGTISSYAISCSSTVSTVGLSFSGSTLSGTPNSDISLSNCRVSAQNSSGVAYTNYFSIVSGGSAGASATVSSDNNITINSIDVNSTVEGNSSVTDGVFTTITKGKLSGSSFDDIKDQLSEIYNLKITIENSSTLSDITDKNITLGALVHDTNKSGVDNRFVLVGIPALMSKSGDSLRIEVEADSSVTMFGRDVSSNSVVFSADLTNDSANIRTGTATSGQKTWTVNLERVFNAFAGDNDVGNYIESIIHDTATNAGSYDIYIFLSNSAFSGSDAIAFTNDKEDIDLNTLTGISSGSSADTVIDSLFGASSDLKGFKGTLVLQ